MIADNLPELMRIQVDAIKNIKIDSITVWDQGSGGDGGQGSTANFMQDVLKFVPGFEDVYGMLGKELPSMLQGAGTKVAKELEATKNAETIDAIEVKDEDASRDTEESTEG